MAKTKKYKGLIKFLDSKKWVYDQEPPMRTALLLRMGDVQGEYVVPGEAVPYKKAVSTGKSVHGDWRYKSYIARRSAIPKEAVKAWMLWKIDPALAKPRRHKGKSKTRRMKTVKKKFLTIGFLVLAVAPALSACATPVTVMQHEKTGTIARCGGSVQGSMAGGIIGYEVDKANDEDCVTDYESAGYKVIRREE